MHLLSPISFFTWSHSRYTLWKLVTKQSKSKARRSIIIATMGNILAYIHLILLDAFTICKHTTKQDGQLSMCLSHCISTSQASTDTVCVSFKSSLRLQKGNFHLLPSAAISSPLLNCTEAGGVVCAGHNACTGAYTHQGFRLHSHST